MVVVTVFGAASLGVGYAEATGRIVVGHDINTLATFLAGTNEETFAVNVAGFLTSDSATKNLLLFESNPGDGTRDFAAGVLTALMSAGFSVTVTADYTTPYTSYDAIFVAENYPEIGFLDNDALTAYANGGGSVYLAGGVGPVASTEAAGWSTFLGNFGLAFASDYNGIYTPVPITSSHPIFAGVTSLRAGNGQFIIDLGTNPNAQIVQRVGDNGVYAVVDQACDSTPVSGCQPAVPQKAQLQLKKGKTSTANKLLWQWVSSGTVNLSDFGDPSTSTSYLLCVYDATGALLRAEALAGGMCGTKPCWKASGKTGFTYTNKAGTPAGLTKVILKAGKPDHGKLQVKGAGTNLSFPTLPLTTPVRAQLRQSGSSICWEATYSTVSKNTATEFKAKSN
jgi:hypothetical protein